MPRNQKPGIDQQSLFLRVLLSFCSVLICLLVLEMGYRVVHWEWGWSNFLEAELRYFWTQYYPVRHDPLLGWIPRPGLDEFGGRRVSIDSNGVRLNGSSPRNVNRDGTRILAVGDSFTFGEEVSDQETWPAYLEMLLERPVFNGGVFGYGVDQSYLMATRLMEKLNPQFVVFGLIPDDISRCEISVRSGIPKPFFRPVSGDVELANTPLSDPGPRKLHPFKQISGFSFSFYKMMRKAFPKLWLEGSESRAAVPGQGDEIACRLLRKLAAQTEEENRTLVVLIQYQKDPQPASLRQIDRLRTCVQRDRVRWVDLRPTLERIREYSPDEYDALFGELHMTARGNRLVAQELQKHLQPLLQMVSDRESIRSHSIQSR